MSSKIEASKLRVTRLGNCGSCFEFLLIFGFSFDAYWKYLSIFMFMQSCFIRIRIKNTLTALSFLPSSLLWQQHFVEIAEPHLKRST